MPVDVDSLAVIGIMKKYLVLPFLENKSQKLATFIFLVVSKELTQGLHRHEKYLNLQDCLEKSFKIKFALKST